MTKAWKNLDSRPIPTMTSSVQVSGNGTALLSADLGKLWGSGGKVTSFPTSRITWSDIHPQLDPKSRTAACHWGMPPTCGKDGEDLFCWRHDDSCEVFGLEVTHDISTNPHFKGTIDDIRWLYWGKGKWTQAFGSLEPNCQFLIPKQSLLRAVALKL